MKDPQSSTESISYSVTPVNLYIVHPALSIIIACRNKNIEKADKYITCRVCSFN